MVNIDLWWLFWKTRLDRCQGPQILSPTCITSSEREKHWAHHFPANSFGPTSLHGPEPRRLMHRPSPIFRWLWSSAAVCMPIVAPVDININTTTKARANISQQKGSGHLCASACQKNNYFPPTHSLIFRIRHHHMRMPSQFN